MGRHNLKPKTRHGTDPKLWPSLLGLAAAALAIVSLLLLVFMDPQWKP